MKTMKIRWLSTFQMTIQFTRTLTILLHHFLCFGSLLFIMPCFRTFVLFSGFRLLFFHHPFRLAHRATGAMAST